MKAMCRSISAGGEGSVKFGGYKSKGLRNKRKSIWATQRRTNEMIKKMKERQESRQYDEDMDYED